MFIFCSLPFVAFAGWFATLPVSAQVLVALWVTMLGGCFGSFMNVVIYRVPAGLSVVHPGSRCPKCLHAIRSYDNIPILSWLWLRGRCRDCGVPIAARYPAVEALVAGVCLCLAAIEIFFGGPNLPWRNNAMVDAIGDYRVLWAVYASHVLLLCTLICAALIEFDGHVIPAKIFFPAWIVGGLTNACWPALSVGHVSEETRSLLDALVAGPIGAVIGAGMGLMIVPLARQMNSLHQNRWSLCLVFASIGLFLGSKAVTAIAVATAVCSLVLVIGSRRENLPERNNEPRSNWSVSGLVTFWTFLAIVAWPFLQRYGSQSMFASWVEGPEYARLLSTAASLAIVSWVVSALNQRRNPSIQNSVSLPSHEESP